MSDAPIIRNLRPVTLDFSEVTKINAEKGAIAALNHLATKLGVETVIKSNSERAYVELGVNRGDVTVIFETLPGATHASSTTSEGKTIKKAAEDYLKRNFLETSYPLHSIKVSKLDEKTLDAWFDNPANKRKQQAPDFQTLAVFKIQNAPGLAA